MFQDDDCDAAESDGYTAQKYLKQSLDAIHDLRILTEAMKAIRDKKTYFAYRKDEICKHTSDVYEISKDALLKMRLEL